MQHQLSKIQAFLSSPQCLFSFSANLDYPPILIQQLINSYFWLKQILTRPHAHILREFSTQAEKQMVQLVQSVIYYVGLQHGNIEKIRQYVMIFRVQMWELLGRQFDRLLSQHGDLIKPEKKINLILVFDLMMGYNMCTSMSITLVANFVNPHDTSIQSQKLIKCIIQVFSSRLTQSTTFPVELITLICHFLLPKLMKILPTFAVLQSQLISLMTLLFNKYSNIIQPLHSQLMYIIQGILPSAMPNTPKQHSIPISQTSRQFLTILRQQFKSKITNQISTVNNNNVMKDVHKYMTAMDNQQILFGYLPRKLQLIVKFIFEHNLQGNQLNYQLNWIQKIISEIYIDMARWAAYMSTFIQQRMAILDWICRKTVNMQKDGCFQRVKRSIFSTWFTQSDATFNLQNCATSVILLRGYLLSSVNMSIELLKFILKMKPLFSQRIKTILQEYIKAGQIKLEYITENRLIPESMQQQFNQLINQQSKPVNKNKQTIIIDQRQGSALKFNPDSPNKSEQQIRPSSSEQARYFPTQSKQVFQFPVSQQFVSEFDDELSNMLDNPNGQTFAVFYKKLLKIATQSRNNDKQLISTLVVQSSKIIYVAFNSQFQVLPASVPTSPAAWNGKVIYFLLQILLKEFHQITHRLEITKQIVKKIGELFPTAEVAFWYYFVVCFEPQQANCKKLKVWLIDKTKEQYFVDAVEAIIGRPDYLFRKKFGRYTANK